MNISIGLHPLTLDELKSSLASSLEISISAEAEEKIKACRAYLDKKIEDDSKLYYGINTGFGFLQNVSINKKDIEKLQYNLLVSHACGMGSEVPPAIVKLMILLKIKSLSYGHSGVQNITVARLVAMYNHNVLPVIYTQGSLGASGDLAPLSHLALPLIGLGEVYFEEKKSVASAVLKQLNWQPITLQSKEGLALINGTQFMLAYGIYCLAKAERLWHWANIISAISFDGFDCTTQPLHPAIHQLRPHKGQVEVATRLLEILNGSEIAKHTNKQVQDPYSFRCIPQVHGATKDTIDFVQNTFLQEANAVTDNPNVFPDEDLILSGGNFHGQPLALALDFLCIAMSEIASISERRIYQLISGQRNLPLFLVHEPGLNSGLMIPQYTAASIVSQNKQLCTPASVDTMSSSNNQEDHVSMGANAATKCYQIIENTERVLAIELLTAAQALEFRRPLKSSPIIEDTIAAFRNKVSFNDADRLLHTDMKAAIEFLQQHTAYQTKQL